MSTDDEHDGSSEPGIPPEAWAPARRLALRVVAPVERFLAIEASSGIVLLAAAAVALVWANSPWGGAYAELWHTPIGFRLGSLSFERDLHFWINDGLMTIFFFVVGLEIRREIHRGELSELRRAALPLAAALGGMVAPAGVFLVLNGGLASVHGWAIPMATDIAFAVGVLALLGKRVPPALRILLLTLAVIDDVGAILVIALFYSSGIAPLGLALVAVAIGAVVVFQKLGVRTPLAYVAPAVAVWAGVYGAGLHPTLAGVLVGLMTPVRPWFTPKHLLVHADASAAALRQQDAEDPAVPHLQELGHAVREAVSPVERLEHALHGWVAFGVMPLFALANAGVTIGGASLTGDGVFLFFGVMLGFALGKPIGVLGLSWLCVRLGVAALPAGVSWANVALVGLVSGIGFTMAIFIAQLAFPSGMLLETAKLAVLSASVSLAVLAYVLGRILLPPAP